LLPDYEQRTFGPDERRGRLRLVASMDGREGSVTVHQDVSLFAGNFDRGEEASLGLLPGRKAWIQVVRGTIDVNAVRLDEGDGLAVESVAELRITGGEGAEILVFDLS
jgi:redox-sensitive bicupin YhaK (pirin superfamily)